MEQNSEATISVVERNGDKYCFVLRTRNRPHLKPVFQSHGWLSFVRAHRLEVDDTVHFWKERRGNEDVIGVQVGDRPSITFLMGYAIAFN